MTIRGLLLAELPMALPDLGVVLHDDPMWFLEIPSPCERLGSCWIADDLDEAIVSIGWTHFHVEAPDFRRSEGERLRYIVDQLLDFLRVLVVYRIVIWRLDRDPVVGGLHEVPGDLDLAGVPAQAEAFLWSRCVQDGAGLAPDDARREAGQQDGSESSEGRDA